MRVYVAGAWIEREARAVKVIKQLRDAGVTITHDWTTDDNNVSSAAKSDAELPKEYRLKHAEADMRGVLSADFVLLLAPTDRGASGAWAEFGIAIGANVPVVVAGGTMNRTIFTELARANYKTDQEGVDRILSEHRTPAPAPVAPTHPSAVGPSVKPHRDLPLPFGEKAPGPFTDAIKVEP